MSDAGTIKVNEAFQRAREQLAEEARRPRPSLSTYEEVKDFVNKARVEVVPAVEYYKATDTTLITLQNREGKKVQIDAALIDGMVEASRQDTQNVATRTVLANARTAVASYADSIDRVRSGRPQPAPVSRGGLKLVA